MKEVEFLGDSLKAIVNFPKNARQAAGRQLAKLQNGNVPDDFKAMPDIGKGVEEIRVRDRFGIYRVIYTARLAMPSTFCTHFKRRRCRLPNRILKSPGSGSKS
jgi:phage-related protein